MVSEGLKVGDRVYCVDLPQSPMKVLAIDGDTIKVERLANRTAGNYKASDLKLWEFKYYPGQWVKLKGSMYHQYIASVDRFKTEPDDGLKYYRVMLAPWLDKETDAQLIAQSAIEYDVLEPVWMNLDDGDRVAKKCETTSGGYISGTLTDAYSLSDTLEVKVSWDSGEISTIQLQELLPFDSPWRVGDRVTEDINTENAYKEGWASERNRTHGTIAYFEKSSKSFNPWIRKADGSLAIANPQSLQPYAGNEPLTEPEAAEPPMTAEQVIEEMDRAMRGEAPPEPEQPIEPEPAQRETFAETYEAEGRAIVLQDLAAQINQAHADCEQAREIAQSAQQSALEHAKRCGELLLQAKHRAGHGNWESWREAHLQLPSSTAALYQRVADRWDELQEAEALTLRDADRILRKSKPRLQAAAAKSATPTKSTTVVDLPEPPAAEPTAPEQTIEQRDYKAGEAIEVGGQSLQVLLVGSDSVTAVDDSGRPHRIAFKANPAEPEQRDSEPQLLGQPDIFYAIRKFALLNGRMWSEKVCDRVTADVMQLLGEWEP